MKLRSRQTHFGPTNEIYLPLTASPSGSIVLVGIIVHRRIWGSASVWGLLNPSGPFLLFLGGYIEGTADSFTTVLVMHLVLGPLA